MLMNAVLPPLSATRTAFATIPSALTTVLANRDTRLQRAKGVKVTDILSSNCTTKNRSTLYNTSNSIHNYNNNNKKKNNNHIDVRIVEKEARRVRAQENQEKTSDSTQQHNGYFGRSLPTSFPGSLFSASIVVEKTTMDAEKRDPGNEVGSLQEYGQERVGDVGREYREWKTSYCESRKQSYQAPRISKNRCGYVLNSVNNTTHFRVCAAGGFKLI